MGYVINPNYYRLGFGILWTSIGYINKKFYSYVTGSQYNLIDLVTWYLLKYDYSTLYSIYLVNLKLIQIHNNIYLFLNVKINGSIKSSSKFNLKFVSLWLEHRLKKHKEKIEFYKYFKFFNNKFKLGNIDLFFKLNYTLEKEYVNKFNKFFKFIRLFYKTFSVYKFRFIKKKLKNKCLWLKKIIKYLIFNIKNLNLFSKFNLYNIFISKYQFFLFWKQFLLKKIFLTLNNKIKFLTLKKKMNIFVSSKDLLIFNNKLKKKYNKKKILNINYFIDNIMNTTYSRLKLKKLNFEYNKMWNYLKLFMTLNNNKLINYNIKLNTSSYQKNFLDIFTKDFYNKHIFYSSFILYFFNYIESNYIKKTIFYKNIIIKKEIKNLILNSFLFKLILFNKFNIKHGLINLKIKNIINFNKFYLNFKKGLYYKKNYKKIRLVKDFFGRKLFYPKKYFYKYYIKKK